MKKTKKREKAFLGLLVLLSLSSLAMTQKRQTVPATRAYVMSYKDFRLHTEIHIQNVRRLGMALYDRYQDTEFKGVSRQMLAEKLRLHDHEKLASEKELVALGYEHNSPLGERLYQYYGEDKLKLSVAEREQFQDLIEELNFFAGKYDLAFYEKYGLLSDPSEPDIVAQKIALIEKVADLVERESNPISIEEFHREKMQPAEDFFSDPGEKKMARYLQQRYDDTIRLNPLEQRSQQVLGARNLPFRCHGIYLNGAG
jgi:hypothetical protein